MSDCEKILLSLVSSLILFSLGILYKTFEIGEMMAMSMHFLNL